MPKQFHVSVETAGLCEEGHPQHKIGWRTTDETGMSRESSQTPEQDKLTLEEMFELLQCFSVGTQAILDWHGHILKDVELRGI